MTGGAVYINIGKIDGVKPGDTYSIVEREEITDPDSGQVLGADDKLIGKCQVVKVMGDHLATCNPVSGKDFKPGQVVKRKD